MEFLNETLYNKAALDALVRISGFTVRRTKTTRSRMLFLLVGLLGLGFGFFFPPESDYVASLSRAFGFIFLMMAILWYPMQCFPNFFTGKNAEARRIRFRDEGFGSDSQFAYDELTCIAHSQDWIALFWDEKHGVILDKDGFIEGSADEFIDFLSQKTDTHIISI